MCYNERWLSIKGEKKKLLKIRSLKFVIQFLPIFESVQEDCNTEGTAEQNFTGGR